MAHFAHAMAHARNVLLRGCHRTAPCPASGARCRGAHCHWLPARPGAACTSPVPRTPLRSRRHHGRRHGRRSARHSTGVLSCGCCVLNNVAISNNGTTTRHRSRSQKTKTKNKKLVRLSRTPPRVSRHERDKQVYNAYDVRSEGEGRTDGARSPIYTIQLQLLRRFTVSFRPYPCAERCTACAARSSVSVSLTC